MIEEAIGLGLLISLLFSETLGLAAGGMVVPGYVALLIHQPLRLAGTIVVSLVTLGSLKLLSRYTLIYGRRRIVVAVLFGFIYGALSRDFLVFHLGATASQYRRAEFSLFIGSVGWRQRLARRLRGEIAYRYEHRGYNPDFGARRRLRRPGVLPLRTERGQFPARRRDDPRPFELSGESNWGRARLVQTVVGVGSRTGGRVGGR